MAFVVTVVGFAVVVVVTVVAFVVEVVGFAVVVVVIVVAFVVTVVGFAVVFQATPQYRFLSQLLN